MQFNIMLLKVKKKLNLYDFKICFIFCEKIRHNKLFKNN